MTITTISALARIRRRAALTQAEVAERVGTTQQRVAAWERGANTPQARHLRQLAAVLGVEVAEIYAAIEQSQIAKNMHSLQSPRRAAA